VIALWIAVGVASVGCAALKLSGYVVPSQVLQRRALQRSVEALPVALLSALIGVAVFTSGNHLVLDSRAAGLAVAIILVVLRAPFVVVVVAGCAVAAGVHALYA
jgi:branched-subunit amino acid transport protein